MSYILDALRKAEHERHLGQPPALAVLPPADRTPRKRFWPWLGAGLILGVNVALLAFFLIQPQPAVLPVAATPPASVTTTAPVPYPIQSLPSAPTPAQSTPPAPATPRKPAASEPSRPTVAPAGRERRDEPVRPPVTPGSVTLAPAPEPVRLLETLPAGARRGIPALSLDIHVYSRDSDKRFAVINGRRYREGEHLSEGPTLEAVTADGAILRQGGQRFRLPVRR
jgi:general secretion pathway protein B